MKLQLKNVSPASEIQLSDEAFGRKYNEALVHQVVTAYMAAGRAGTKRQKSRAEVRGGGKKPGSQKGTGQARAGAAHGPEDEAAHQQVGRIRPEAGFDSGRGLRREAVPRGRKRSVCGRDGGVLARPLELDQARQGIGHGRRIEVAR